MASSARIGTFDELMDQCGLASDSELARISHALRGIILAQFPEAVEVVRLGDKAASYGVGQKKMSESHVYIMPLAKHVNLGFYHGVNVPDPDGLMEGTGKKMRHVKVRSLKETHKEAIPALIDAALTERRKALGLD